MDNFSQQTYSQQPNSGQPAMSNLPPVPPTQINPVQPQENASKKPKITLNDKQKTIVIITAFSVALVIFIILSIVMFVKYNDAKSNLEEKIDVAVAKAKDEQAEALEAEFAEREKSPYNDFAGPEDYGSLSFKYPKTWSVFIASDASNGDNFEAYFNPGEIHANPAANINALRVSIVNRSAESIKADFQRIVEDPAANLHPEEISINKTSATHYFGTIPGTEFIGHIVLFKIRDKTAILQSDSELFANDFDAILESITFND